MATIIDSLVVRLGLDSSEFDKGTKKVDDSLGKLVKNAAKFVAILGGTAAIKRFVEQTIQSNAQLERFAKNLGESVSGISALSNEAELAGGSAQGLQASLRMLSMQQTQLQLTGESGLIPYLSALGVSMTDAYGKAKPVNDLLIDIGQALLDRTPNRQTAFNMGAMMGIDEGTLNLILQGRKEVEFAMKRQNEFTVVTKAQAEEGLKLSRSLIEGKQAFNAFGRELLYDASPAIEKVVVWLANLGTWMRQNKEFVRDFLVIVATGITAIAVASIPFTGTAALIAAVGAAIAGLYQDYQVWKRGGDSLIDWGKWQPGIKKTIDALRVIRDLLRDITSDSFWKNKPTVQDYKNAASSAVEYGKTWLDGLMINRHKKEQEQAVSYFQSQGWTKEQAIGIAANIERESAFKANAVGDNGKAYGIAQWHADRQAEFKKLFGKDIRQSTLAEQLQFMNYELTQGKEKAAGSALRSATTSQQAAAIVSRKYERPADSEGEAKRRAYLAGILNGTVGKSAMANAMASAGKGASVGGSSNSSNVETHIGQITIQTQATDAQGIASGIGGALNNLIPSQANAGIN